MLDSFGLTVVMVLWLLASIVGVLAWAVLRIVELAARWARRKLRRKP